VVINLWIDTQQIMRDGIVPEAQPDEVDPRAKWGMTVEVIFEALEK